MITFEHLVLADNRPLSFAIPWMGETGDWTTLEQPLKVQFRLGNLYNSDVIADSDLAIEDSAVYGVNRALVVTLKDFIEPLPESYLYYDVLTNDGIRFVGGSIEIIRGQTA
jgi:hypothetical protein